MYVFNSRKIKIKNLIATLFLISSHFVSGQSSFEKNGDFTANALPAASVLIPLATLDWEKVKMSVKSIAVATATVHSIKRIVGKRRPDFDVHTQEFNSGLSFPSGHTQAAFSGASLLHAHYGSYVGIPAYLIAAYTGYSRIDADKHYFDDVVAGAAIGVFSTYYFTDKSDISVRPTVGDDKFGAQVTIKEGASSKLIPEEVTFKLRTLYNQVNSDDLDSQADAVSLGSENDELATSRASLELKYPKGYSLGLEFRPTELKGPSYMSGEKSAADFESFAFDIVLSREIFRKNRLSYSLGLGVTYQYYELTFYKPFSNEESSSFSDSALYGDLSSKLSYQFSENHSSHLKLLYGLGNEASIYNASISHQIKLNKKWGLGFGISHEARNYPGTSPVENLSLTGPFLDLSYRF